MRPTELDVCEQDELAETMHRFDQARYTVTAASEHSDLAEYRSLIQNAYEPLGFMKDEVLPSADSECFQLRYGARLVAVFRLTPVASIQSPYFSMQPFRDGNAPTVRRLIEVNNVVVDADFRATIVLGLILEACATIGAERGFDYVVGITRHQTLRYFVDFGVIPIDHEPLHLMGREDILDFAIYYDLTSDESRGYIRQRSKRYFHQQRVMRSISLKYGSRGRTVRESAARAAS